MHSLSSLAQLPDNAIVALKSHSILQVEGPDTHSFLQGQLTVNLESLSDEEARIAAQCDAKGKMVGLGHLVKVDDSVWFVQHRDEISASLAQFQKFGVFAKADFTVREEYVGFAFIGDEAKTLAKACDVHYALPAVENVFIGWTTDASQFADTPFSVQENDVFDALRIRAGVATLRANMAGEWVPQMLNVQALNGIDYDKGCYMGQETVARTHFLGRNKRQAIIVKTAGHSNPTDLIGQNIEQQIGENWRTAGKVIDTAALGDELWLLAVVPNDLDANTQLRVPQTFELTIQPLPYVIKTNESSIKKRTK